MRQTEKVKIGAHTLTVKELTVGEVRQWLAKLSSGEDVSTDVTGMLLFQDFSLHEIALFVSEPVESDELTQSEVRDLLSVIKRLNPDFFALRERLLKMGTVSRNSETPETEPEAV